MRPRHAVWAEYKAATHSLRCWIVLLFTVLALAIAWIPTRSVLKRQHKLIRFAPRSSEISSARIADSKSSSAIRKQHEPKPYALPAGDPRLLAALSGHSDAQFELGVAYARGQGVQADYTVASTWLILAKANGDRRAESLIRELTPKLNESETGRIRWNLGEMYANGFGVRADKVTAYMWHRLAEVAGENRSKSAKAKLESAMTRGEVSEANARADLWLRRHHLSHVTCPKCGKTQQDRAEAGEVPQSTEKMTISESLSIRSRRIVASC